MVRLQQIETMQEKDEIIKYLTTKEVPALLKGSVRKAFRKRADKFKWSNEVLYFSSNGKRFKRFYCVFEEEEKKEIVRLSHQQAHRGTKKIYKLLQVDHYAITREMVDQIVSSCSECLVANPNPIRRAIKTKHVRQRFQMDCVDDDKTAKDLTESRNRFLCMNLASNTSVKSQGIKRPAPVPITGGELGDVKPCKRQLHAQKSIQMEHNYPKANNTGHPNPFQVATSHQSSPVAQSQQGHSQITIVSQNHHVTTGQLNHQVSVSQHNYPKANNTGHPNPFQVATSQQSHQMTTGQKNHQNVTIGHPNPHQVTTGQPMITDQQSQPQINTGHQKRQQLNPAQLRFLETGQTQPNRIEVPTGQQQSETVQESSRRFSTAVILEGSHVGKTKTNLDLCFLDSEERKDVEDCLNRKKTVPKVPDSRRKQSSTPDAMCPSSASKLSSVPQMNKKTFTISKHKHTVMSSLASLWKDSKLCDATIGNGSFKIMVHKLVLLAISPKLLSQADIKANCFIRVNLPEEVSQAALVAFSGYMYHGVLTLDPILLQQLRIIALQLGIRELELLCDTHLLYCDLQNSTVDSSLDLPETCTSSLLGSPPEAFTSTAPSQRISAVPEFKMIKQEGICEEFTLNSSLKDFALAIKEEPVDHTSNSSAQNILNSSVSPNVNKDLLNTKYQQHNLDAPVLYGQYNEAFLHPTSSEFESSATPLCQGAADCLLELNDSLQLQKSFKKSDFPNVCPSDKSTVSLSPNPCASQSNDLVDHEIGYNKNSHATNTDNPIRQNCGDQSKKHPAMSTSRRISQPLEVLKETAELLTFQITDIRSVQQTIDIT